MSAFDPNSDNAMFSRILTRLEQQDQVTERNHMEVKAVLERNTQRIDVLERDKWYQRGIVAALSFICTGLFEYFTGSHR